MQPKQKAISKKKSTPNEIRDLCDQILKDKSTSSLYKLKETIEKCLQEDQKSIRNRPDLVECLQKLSNLIPSKIFHSLLAKAIELNDTDLCILIVNNVQLLEENQAVDCLKYFLRDVQLKEDEKAETDLPVDSKTSNLLDVLFRRAYDYHLLKLELKRLSSNEFIVTLCLTIIILLNQEFKPFRVSNYKICLEYLHSYLKTAFHNENSNEEGFEDVQAMDTSDPTLHQNPTTRPTIYQISSLFCCLVDAHFTHISLSNRAQEIVADLLQLIETQLDIFFDLMSIESLVKEMKQNREFKMKDNNNIAHYYIEVLKLS